MCLQLLYFDCFKLTTLIRILSWQLSERLACSTLDQCLKCFILSECSCIYSFCHDSECLLGSVRSRCSFASRWNCGPASARSAYPTTAPLNPAAPRAFGSQSPADRQEQEAKKGQGLLQYYSNFILYNFIIIVFLCCKGKSLSSIIYTNQVPLLFVSHTNKHCILQLLFILMTCFLEVEKDEDQDAVSGEEVAEYPEGAGRGGQEQLQWWGPGSAQQEDHWGMEASAAPDVRCYTLHFNYISWGWVLLLDLYLRCFNMNCPSLGD